MNAPDVKVTPPPAPAAAPAVVQTGLRGDGSNLAKVLNAGKFAVCVEVSPPVGPNLEAIQREIKTLKGYGDAYNVTDNQSAMVHVSISGREHHAQAGRHGAGDPVYRP